jgi:glycosyltransferase involved in cell wall biosynthesis
MKIFIISKQYSSPWSEGIRNLARRLALFLEKKQEDVSVLTEASHNLGEYGISIKTWRLPFIRQLSFIVKSALFIRQANPSVILLFSSCSSFLGLKTKLLKALCHCPVFVYVCGLHKWIGGYTWCYSADKTFVISPFLKEYFPNARIVYPWIPQHLRDYSSLDRAIEKGERNRVLFLGSFEKERGVEYLLEAISLLKSKLRVYLTLAWNGTGEERYKYITDLIKQLKIDDIVTIERQVDINRVYREYDLLVIPRVSSIQ